METSKSKTGIEKVIRCVTCNTYWRVVVPSAARTCSHMFKCARGHFSEFEFEEHLVVDADVLTTIFIPIDQHDDDTLLADELTWVKRQTAKLYDCGFFATMLGEKSPLPSLDLADIQHPDTASMLYDSKGNEFKLAISPNGISYYILIGHNQNKDKKKEEDNADAK